jgi:hypothetical protein
LLANDAIGGSTKATNSTNKNETAVLFTMGIFQKTVVCPLLPYIKLCADVIRC